MRQVAQQVIDNYHLDTLDSIVRAVPRFMCHVMQEPKVYDTYRSRGALTSRIASYDTLAYFKGALEPKERPPASCIQFAEVAAILAAVTFQADVYVIGATTPSYVRRASKVKNAKSIVQEFAHAFNYMNGTFFDASAYAQVFDQASNKWVDPSQLQGFNAANIDYGKYIKWDHWLQSSPHKRVIAFSGPTLTDTWQANAPMDSKSERYLKIISP